MRPLALLFSAALAPALAAQDRLSELDAFVARGMREWRIPGLAIAVVRNDSVVFVKGYGVRSVEGTERVDTRTRFGMMSTTKAVTALALAMPVDEGKVARDDPVTKHLPWLRLAPPWVTEAITVRDLLTHRTGLGMPICSGRAGTSPAVTSFRGYASVTSHTHHTRASSTRT